MQDCVLTVGDWTCDKCSFNSLREKRKKKQKKNCVLTAGDWTCDKCRDNSNERYKCQE